jgi:hypothetical protein
LRDTHIPAIELWAHTRNRARCLSSHIIMPTTTRSPIIFFACYYEWIKLEIFFFLFKYISVLSSSTKLASGLYAEQGFGDANHVPLELNTIAHYGWTVKYRKAQGFKFRTPWLDGKVTWILSCCGRVELSQSQTFILSVDWIWIIDRLNSQHPWHFVTSSITLRYKVLEDTIQKELTSPNILPSQVSKLYYVNNMRIIRVSQRMTPRSQRGSKTRVWSDKSCHLRGALGLPNHIKESIKIKQQGLGLSYYVTWCDVLTPQSCNMGAM